MIPQAEITQTIPVIHTLESTGSPNSSPTTSQATPPGAPQTSWTISDIFAVERTMAAWINLSMWVYTIGVLAMNSNQAIAAAELSVRLETPVFLVGLLLALSGVFSVAYHLRLYSERMRMFRQHATISNRGGIYTTVILLLVVMVSALIGSAFYGASEVVQVT